MPEQDRKLELGFWSGLFVVGVAGVATLIVTSAFRLDENWKDAIYTTAVMFSALILALRPAWPSPALWRDLSVALAVHLILLSLIVRLFDANRLEMGGAWRTVAALAEGLFLLVILWRRNIAQRH